MDDLKFSSGKAVKFNGEMVTVKELTAIQIRRLFEYYEEIDENSVLYLMLIDETPVPPMAIAESSGIALEELETGTPTEILKLAKEVEQVNPFLLKLVEKGSRYAQELEILSEREKEAT